MTRTRLELLPDHLSVGLLGHTLLCGREEVGTQLEHLVYLPGECEMRREARVVRGDESACGCHSLTLLFMSLIPGGSM